MPLDTRESLPKISRTTLPKFSTCEMKRCGSVGMYGFAWITFWISCCVRLCDSVSRARLLISSWDMMLKPALWGGVKNGLKVLMAKGPSEQTRQPFVMFVAIPVCTTMSAVCHCVKSLVARGPFFVLRSAMSLVVGSVLGFSPSVELANWITFLKVGSSFFQTRSSPFVSASSAVANLSFCWSSRVLVRRLMPRARESSVVVLF